MSSSEEGKSDKIEVEDGSESDPEKQLGKFIYSVSNIGISRAYFKFQPV